MLSIGFVYDHEIMFFEKKNLLSDYFVVIKYAIFI